MKRLMLILPVVLLAVLFGCSSEYEQSTGNKSTNETAQQDGEKIRLGWWTDGGFPSPFAFSPKGPAGYLRVSYLYDTLTWKNEDGIQPWLAKEWKISDDGLSYTVKLREGIKWHDGKALTTSDVKFTFEYLEKHGFAWGDTSMVKKVEAKNDTTAIITLNKPYSPFVSEVMGIIPIIPEHIWSGIKDPVSFRGEGAAVGTGPFTLESYNQESGQYRFKANPDYFKAQPTVDEITYVTVSNRILALKNKKIDAVMTSDYKSMQALKKAGYKVLESQPDGSIVRIVFNLTNDSLSQTEMRQAIAYALDRATIAKKVLGGNGVVGNAAVIPPGSPWYNPNVKQYDLNLQKSKKMLEALGYKDRDQDGIRETKNGKVLEFSLMVSSNERDGQLMQAMLKKAGIKVNLRKVDKATFTASMGENNYDMAITGHIGVSGDPDFLRRWFSGESYNTFSARGAAWKNERFQKLAKKQLVISDFEKRKQVVDQMQAALAEEIPTLPLYHRPFYWIYDASKFDGWFNTWGGIANGIPLWENKAAFLSNEN
jgi:peptide/nickel transport system substrate-binding protein